MWTSYKKRIYLFILIIFSIGIISGIFIFNKFKNDEIINSINSLISNNNFNINNIFSHLIICSVIILFSFIGLGIPLTIMYLFYNGLSIGIIISIFTIIKGIKGYLYSIVFIIVSKLINVSFLFIFSASLIKFSLLLINYIFKKNKDIKRYLLVVFKKLILCYFLIIINDILVYYFSDNILKIFNFLI